EMYRLDEYTIEGQFILRRRRQWASPDEMFASFKGRGPYAEWQDAVLRDYCQYGLIPDGDGYTLACAPEVEAHIYASAPLRANADVYGAIDQIKLPVRVLRCAKTRQSGQEMLVSPTAPDLASKFQHGLDVLLPDNTHFIPMESPDLVAR